MKIENVNALELRKTYNKDSLESVIYKSHAGNTLLFIGAGFSSGSKTCDKSPPLMQKNCLRKYVA